MQKCENWLIFFSRIHINKFQFIMIKLIISFQSETKSFKFIVDFFLIFCESFDQFSIKLKVRVKISDFTLLLKDKIAEQRNGRRDCANGKRVYNLFYKIDLFYFYFFLFDADVRLEIQQNNKQMENRTLHTENHKRTLENRTENYQCS